MKLVAYYSYHTSNLPRLVCWTRLVAEARLLSVQMNQTTGLYAGPRCLSKVLWYAVHVVLRPVHTTNADARKLLSFVASGRVN